MAKENENLESTEETVEEVVADEDTEQEQLDRQKEEEESIALAREKAKEKAKRAKTKKTRDAVKTSSGAPFLRGLALVAVSALVGAGAMYVSLGNKTTEETTLVSMKGDTVTVGQTLFTHDGEAVTSTVSGKVKIDKTSLTLSGEELGVKEYVVAGSKGILVKDGALVEAGDQLTEGSLDLHQIHKLKGQEFTQKYIMREIQHIYSSQGQKLNDKHVEVIARQMFSKVYVVDAGDSDLMPGEVVEYIDVANANKELKKEGKQLVQFDRLLMGITKVSLATRSWLAAASFQETSKVLINAAVSGKTDDLSGLKENIIIGRLIPAGTGFKE